MNLRVRLRVWINAVKSLCGNIHKVREYKRIRKRSKKDPCFIAEHWGYIAHVFDEELKYVVYKALTDKKVDFEKELQRVMALYSIDGKHSDPNLSNAIKICSEKNRVMYENKVVPTPITNWCPWSFSYYYDGTATPKNGNFESINK